jgi:hypothetical protein
MAPSVLYEDPYARVTHDPTRRLVQYRRSDLPYPTPAIALQSIHRQRSAMLSPPRTLDCVILMDVRDGPLRTDPEFEQVMKQSSPDMGQHFKRCAVLVRTAIGRLQLTRHLTERRSPSLVFDDESRALAWLLAP